MAKRKSAKTYEGDGPIQWKGKHVFYIAGTEYQDNTIRIPGDGRNKETHLQLIFPTLCITYADMKFANAIGGVQQDYPDSNLYGPAYFNPPVVITGEEKIEKFTWIRGAEKVTIGDKETVIEWPAWRTLIIPKLRIKRKEKIKAVMNIPKITITVAQPFTAKTMQYFDGRHVGGVQIAKRHPNWKPEPVPQEYDLGMRVIDGKTRSAVPEARVSLFEWDEKKGGFVPEAYWYTNSMGIVDASGLPCSDKKLLTIEQSSCQKQIWRFRPLPGQNVRQTFKLWKIDHSTFQYEWRVRDRVEAIAALTASTPVNVLKMNRLRSEKELRPSSIINLPCIKAIYHAQQRDTLERIRDYFCYNSAEELIEANNLAKPYAVYPYQEIVLPGWNFFQAHSNELFEDFDEQFSLPRGWSRPAQKILHDDPARAYKHEIIAVPSKDFICKHKLKRL